MSNTLPENRRATVEAHLQAGIAAVKARRLEEARELLLRVIDEDETNEPAWLWLSGAVTTDDERRICLENVLVLNPNNGAARKGLARLAGTPASPAEAEPGIVIVRKTVQPPSPAGAILYPERLVRTWQERDATTFTRISAVGYKATSSYDDVWNRNDDICAYCAVEVDEAMDRCGACGRNLLRYTYRYEKESTNLHVLWVLLAGLGQLFVIDSIVDIITNLPLPILIFHAFMAALLFVLAAGVYVRRFWAYVTAIVVSLLLLLLTSIGVLGLAEAVLPLAENPAEAMLTTPFIATLADLLQRMQLAATVLTLLWAALFVGPDFDRTQEKRLARLDRRLQEPSGFFSAGRRYAQQGMWATAVLHWQRAVALDPANGHYQRELGRAYARLGFYARSLDVLQSARTLTADTARQAEIEQLLDAVRRRQRREATIHGQ